MVCTKCKTGMKPGSLRGNAREYLCPGCGYRTLGPRESMAQLPRLGTDPASGIEWTEDRPVESPTEAATRPPQTSVTRRRAKAAAKKAEGPDPAFLELQAELRILESEVAAVETVLARELQKLRDRLKGAEEKIGGLSSAPRKG